MKAIKDNTKIFYIALFGGTAIIISIAAMLINRLISAAYDDGWFNGYNEAKKDYDRELSLQRNRYNKLIEERNQRINAGKQRIADLLARRSRTVDSDGRGLADGEQTLQ